MSFFYLLNDAQRHALNASDVIERKFGKNGGIAYHQTSMKIHLKEKKSMLSCKHFIRVHTNEVFARA